MKEKKFKEWLKEHKKEIGLVTIGGVAGISGCFLGKKFYDNVYLTNDIQTRTVWRYGDVGIKYWNKNIFGKFQKKGKTISWNPDTALLISDELKDFAEKAKNK